jgi:hypothetical protein
MSALDDAVRAALVTILATEAQEVTSGNAAEAAELLIDAALTVIISGMSVTAGRRPLALKLSQHLFRHVDSISEEEGA